MRIVIAILFALVGVVSASAQQGNSRPSASSPVLVNKSWHLRHVDMAAGPRLYRRYAIQPKVGVINVLIMVCPRDTAHVHLVIATEKLGGLKSDFPSGFEEFQGRFLIDGRSAFTIPGEVIKSDMFFDRTPETSEAFDKLILADEFVLRAARSSISFKMSPGLSDYLVKWLPKLNADPFTSFGSEAALQDCRTFRGEN